MNRGHGTIGHYSQEQELYLNFLTQRNKRVRQNEDTEEYVPNEVTGQNHSKRWKQNRDK